MHQQFESVARAAIAPRPSSYRSSLLAGAAFGLMAMGVSTTLAVSVAPAAAQSTGGTGGSGDTGQPGGAGGTPASPNGGPGQTNIFGSGGGGGAPGGTGGAGGFGTGTTSGDGGAGGTNPAAVSTFTNTVATTGVAGVNGGSGTGGGGGGGGAGGYAFVVSNSGVTSMSSAAIHGGAGGAGGDGVFDGGGGGGGDGGIAVQYTASGSPNGQIFRNASTIAGGAGGAGGGATASNTGNGGNGGIGVQFNADNIFLANTGTISGGTGGGGGAGSTGADVNNGGGGPPGTNGTDGAGGIGVVAVGVGLVINNAGGTISGGMSGAATPVQADALSFANGGARLVLGNLTTAGTINGGIGVTGSLSIDPGTLDGVNSTLANTIHDATTAGSLIKVGDGGLMLTGTNTYTGGTTISNGTLLLGAGGSIVGDITDNASLAFDRAGASTFAGVISGIGAVTQTGTGTTTLTGTNTYTGGTTFGAGVLSVGADANLGAAAGQLTFAGGTLETTATFSSSRGVTLNTAGTVQTDPDVTTTLSGVIADGVGGARSLTKTGTGTLTLTGANTYTGGTTLSSGTLQIGAGGTTGSIVGDVMENATLKFDRSDTITFAGVISGAGVLSQIGTGTTILTGASTYTGGTTVNAGTLEVDGSITSNNVFVNNGGTLSGTGTTGAPTINGGGTLAPGNAASPTGTLTVDGRLAFAAGSFYNIAITPTASSRTNVVGSTTIAGGTVNVAAGEANYGANTRYTILNATGRVTGTFSAVSSNLAFLMPTLSYDGNDVFLTILPTAPPPEGTPNQPGAASTPDYTVAASTQNQISFASSLTNAGVANDGSGKILNAFNQLTVAQARAAFDSVSGEGITATQNLAYRSAELFNATIFDQTTFYGAGGTGNSVTLTAPQPGFLAYAPQADAPRTPIHELADHELADLPNRAMAPMMPAFAPTRTWRAWGSGFGGVDDIHGNGTIGSATQNNDLYGGAIGVDYQVTPNYLAGLAVGGSEGTFAVPGRATSGSTTGGHIAFYDIATFGSFYGASSNTFSYFTNRTTRSTGGFGGLGGETDRGSFDSHEFRTRLEFGRHLDGYGGTITPFIALEIAELRSNGFSETAVSGPGLLALNVAGQSSASVPAFVGARFQRVTTLGGGMTFSPTLQVAYIHEFAPQRTQIGALANLPGSTFLVDGARPSRDAGQVKFGGELALNAHSFLFANFDGEISGLDQFYGGHGGFKYVW